MVVKRLILLTSLTLLSSCASSSWQTQEEMRFYEFALAICFGSAFNDDVTQNDFNRAANGIMERSHMPLESYEELRDVVGVQLKKDYKSKHGGQIQSLKCFDLMREGAVKKIFEKYNPCKDKSGWLEESEYKESC